MIGLQNEAQWWPRKVGTKAVLICLCQRPNTAKWFMIFGKKHPCFVGFRGPYCRGSKQIRLGGCSRHSLRQFGGHRHFRLGKWICRSLSSDKPQHQKDFQGAAEPGQAQVRRSHAHQWKICWPWIFAPTKAQLEWTFSAARKSLQGLYGTRLKEEA